MADRKQYGALDLAKFIAAILIIALHTAPLSSYSSVLSYSLRNILTVIAVPFFFVTSGFLFFTKINALPQEEKPKYFLNYLKRLALMYLLWSAVYFVFVAFSWIQNGVTTMDVLQYIKRFFFEGSYSTIWFLPALMTAVAIVYLLLKRFSYMQILCMAIPFYLLGCLGSSYYGLAEKLPIFSSFFNAYYSFFDTVKNGVLFGFVYVALGGVFSEKQFEIKPMQSLVLSGVFMCLMAVETVIQTYLGWSTRGVDIKLMLLPLSVFIFLFVMSLSIKSGPIYIWMRKLSLMMFLSQRIFLTLFDYFLTDTVFVKNSLAYFISILGLTLIFSVCFIKLSEKCKVLKKFY